MHVHVCIPPSREKADNTNATSVNSKRLLLRFLFLSVKFLYAHKNISPATKKPTHIHNHVHQIGKKRSGLIHAEVSFNGPHNFGLRMHFLNYVLNDILNDV